MSNEPLTPPEENQDSSKAYEEFITAFLEIVINPWKTACENAEYPWLATPELREKWMQGMESEDDITAFCSAVGVCRCAQLNEEEFLLANEVFFEFDSETYISVPILEILCTGASPPPALLKLFSNESQNSDALIKGTVIFMFLRHPYNSESAKNMPIKDAWGPFYSCIANPCNGFVPFEEKIRDEEGFADNPWVNALRIFHPLNPRITDASLLKNELEKIALLLRCDFTKEEIRKLTSDIQLHPDYDSILTAHPCLFQGPAPIFDAWNPLSAALRYFSQDSVVTRFQKIYNPLLQWPWQSYEDPFEEWPCVMGGLIIGHCGSDFFSETFADKMNLKIACEHPVMHESIKNYLALMNQKQLRDT
jgi:hypothetical protein